MSLDLTFKVDGKMKTFSKDAIYFKDNIRAVKHTIVQQKFFNSENQNEEMYEETQQSFCEMMADIFDGQFSAEQFKSGMTLENVSKAEDIFTLALGGKLDSKEKESEKK